MSQKLLFPVTIALLFGALLWQRYQGDERPPMPRGLEGEEQQALYQTAAGAYTADDIRANGPAPPAEKYRGFRARHDVNPRPGDRLCPVTRTKAHPACTWTIGGEKYSFCCPPCIDEFVQLAKDAPGDIRPPDDYVQKPDAEAGR